MKANELVQKFDAGEDITKGSGPGQGPAGQPGTETRQRGLSRLDGSVPGQGGEAARGPPPVAHQGLGRRASGAFDALTATRLDASAGGGGPPHLQAPALHRPRDAGNPACGRLFPWDRGRLARPAKTLPPCCRFHRNRLPVRVPSSILDPRERPEGRDDVSARQTGRNGSRLRDRTGLGAERDMTSSVHQSLAQRVWTRQLSPIWRCLPGNCRGLPPSPYGMMEMAPTFGSGAILCGRWRWCLIWPLVRMSWCTSYPLNPLRMALT